MVTIIAITLVKIMHNDLGLLQPFITQNVTAVHNANSDLIKVDLYMGTFTKAQIEFS